MKDNCVFLASGSPRRKSIFDFICESFDILLPKNVDELKYHNEPPEKTVVENAVKKAKSVLNEERKGIYISADTEVFFNGMVYGKPKDYNDAFSMIKSLCGQKHIVASGVCIIDNLFHNEKIEFADISFVEFKMLSDTEIKSYISKNNVLDKAGAYAVQYGDKSIVRNVEGSVWNVVGFPLEKFYEIIKDKKYFNLFEKITLYLNMDMADICNML